MTKHFARQLGVVLALAIVGGVSDAAAQSRTRLASDSRPAPYVVDLRQVTFEVVAVNFVKELEGVNARYREVEPDTFRAALVTIRVSKPEGEALTFTAADFSLHYYHGEVPDVVPCNGISAFSTVVDADRPIRLSQNATSKTSTGPATTGAGTIYLDLFFPLLEPDATSFHVAMAQPIAAPFVTEGWGSRLNAVKLR
jgi:hypothetical protein